MTEFGQLVKNLSSEDKNIRGQAILALGKSGDSRAIVPLIELLKRQDTTEEVNEDVIFALVQLGEDALPQVRQLLDDDSGYVRFQGTKTLGKMGDSSVAGDIVPLLEDADSEVRFVAALALGQLKAYEALPALVRRLADDNDFVRDRVFWSVFELTRKDISPLLEGLNSEDARLRENCAMMLGVIGKASALESLSDLMSDDDHEVRLALVQAFDDIGGKRALAYIEQMTHDDHPQVQALVRGILKRLEKERQYKRGKS